MKSKKIISRTYFIFYNNLKSILKWKKKKKCPYLLKKTVIIRCTSFQISTLKVLCLIILSKFHPGKLSLPKRADYLTPKSFGGLGEPEASLGEPRVRKSFQMTLLPSLLGIFVFLIKTLNDHLFHTVTAI